MFFKERLQSAPGRVLELGCGSGNNLLLFQAFGWEVVGVDICADALADAQFNLNFENQTATIYQTDLTQDFPNLTGQFDAIILPSFNYYVPRTSFVKLLSDCSRLLRQGGVFFVRSRTCNDWRHGRGSEIERNGFLLQCTETGEHGLLNVFYEERELIEMISAAIGPMQNQQILKVRYDNPQSGTVITNDDLVIWGRR
jgi:SAM-dependent methyltransferase